MLYPFFCIMGIILIPIAIWDIATSSFAGFSLVLFVFVSVYLVSRYEK